MQLPQQFLNLLEGIPGYNKQTFEQIHSSGEQVTSIRVNPAKVTTQNEQSLANVFFQHSSALTYTKIPWTEYGYYLSERPSFTFDPLFHAGCYYVQEASSQFLEQALNQTTDLSQPLRVLDLCAAPGGKSTHIQSLLAPNSLLVSNEVIKSRAGVLKQNIIKWGCSNVVVTNNDPQHFQRLESFFDVMVVDAPCSGSGLFRRDEEAINEWSEENVLLCCGRQKRILADAFAALKKGGVLIYSTCSYSREEDEDIADWLVDELKMKNERLTIEEEWGIVESKSAISGSYGYRFFPDKIKGEGFFLACFRKTTGDNYAKLKAVKLEKSSAKEKEVVKPWIKGDAELLKDKFVYALPSGLLNSYAIIKNALYIQSAGVTIGEVVRDKLIPDHALAVSNLLAESITRTAVEYSEAVRYLQKQDIDINTNVKGWQIISYKEYNLGWINALQNRVNNYYPKELRILKQRDETAFEK